MRDFILIIASIVFVSIVVLLCFFSCYVSSQADEYWEKIKKDLEKRDNERH